MAPYWCSSTTPPPPIEYEAAADPATALVAGPGYWGSPAPQDACDRAEPQASGCPWRIPALLQPAVRVGVHTGSFYGQAMNIVHIFTGAGTGDGSPGGLSGPQDLHGLAVDVAGNLVFARRNGVATWACSGDRTPI